MFDCCFRDIAINSNADYLYTPGHLLNNGFFRFVRECGNTVDLGLNLIQKCFNVPPFDDFHRNGADALF